MNNRGSLILRFCFLILLLAGFGGMPARSALACEPFPDNWFVETVTLDAEELPAGFYTYDNVGNSPEQLAGGVWLTGNNPQASRRAMIYLINRSDVPLYVLSSEYLDRLVMETPDANYEPRLRMAHEVASYTVRPNSGEVVALEWEALLDLDPTLSDPNQPEYGPPPAGTIPPPAQHSELLMVVGDQVVLLPFTISYSLIQDFRANDCSLGPAGAPDPTIAPVNVGEIKDGKALGLGLAGISLLAVFFWLLWRWRSRR